MEFMIDPDPHKPPDTLEMESRNHRNYFGWNSERAVL
jgi:hypothetical protein